MREALVRGGESMTRGDFEQSLQFYQEVVAMGQGKPPADLASFQIGLIYAHPENPGRDLEKARQAFSQLVSAHPTSPWVAQARVWTEVLKETQEARQASERARLAIEKSKQEIEMNRAAMEKSRQEIERSRAELEKTRQEIEKSRQVIEKSRQVDLEIDQKRRERRR